MTNQTWLKKFGERAHALWSAATCRRFCCLADLSAKPRRVRRRAEELACGIFFRCVRPFRLDGDKSPAESGDEWPHSTGCAVRQARLHVASAFTLLELLVVVAVLALWALLLVPALARTKSDSRAFQCLNNNRELTRAWRMWSDDNEDLLLNSSTNTNDVPAWVTGFLDYSASPLNWSPTNTIMQSPMWPYCGTNLDVWKCPSDRSSVLVNGVSLPRVRSFAMNVYFSSADSFTQTNRSFKKVSEIVNPPPSHLFVFHDVRADGLHDGSFVVNMAGYPAGTTSGPIWGWPGYYHDGSGGFSYADGSGEIHHWVDSRTTPLTIPTFSLAAPRDQDFTWLQDRATRPK